MREAGLTRRQAKGRRAGEAHRRGRSGAQKVRARESAQRLHRQHACATSTHTGRERTGETPALREEPPQTMKRRARSSVPLRRKREDAGGPCRGDTKKREERERAVEGEKSKMPGALPRRDMGKKGAASSAPTPRPGTRNREPAARLGCKDAVEARG